MARGAMVSNGVANTIVEAASGYNPNYYPGVSFVPDDYAQVGDLFDGTTWTYFYAPASITLLQAKKQLTAQGLRVAFEAKITLASQDDKDEWACNPVITRPNSVVTRIAAQLGLTAVQIDTFFRNAAKL